MAGPVPGLNPTPHPVIPAYGYQPTELPMAGGGPRPNTAGQVQGVPPAIPAMMPTDQIGSYDIAPEVFEAFSFVEPMTTNMTTAYDPSWTG